MSSSAPGSRSPVTARLAVAAAALGLLAAAAVARTPAAAQPGAPPGRPAAERVVVELGALTAAEALALAGLLPAWEEPIHAGATRLHVERAAAERAAAAGLPLRLGAAAPAEAAAWPACITPLDGLYDWIEGLAAARPDLVTIEDAGDSHCKAAGGCTTPGGERLAGDDLVVARLTAAGSSAPKTGRLWIDGGLHARELPTTELMRRTVERLVAGYGVDAGITWLLDHREVYVGLAMNPDGRRLVELGATARYGGTPWYWRKNARPRTGAAPCDWPPSSGSHDGVDLNRNHIFKWSAAGASNNACAETYRGTAPGSEPEIAAYEAAVRALMPDRRGPADDDVAGDDASGILINFHNFTNRGTVLTPWGWTTADAPNAAGLDAIARRYAARVDYAWQSALYAVSGNTRDWAYGELGIPAYVIELRGDDFFPRCADLDGILAPHAGALDLLLAMADRPYARIRAPEVAELTARVVAAPGGGHAVRVAARLDAAGTPAGRVAGAEVAIGRPGGPDPAGPAGLPSTASPSGEGAPLPADDGAFDSGEETAAAVVDLAGLPAGRYYAVVSAQAGDGAWGPGRAVWFDLPGDDAATPPPSPPPTATAAPTPTASPPSPSPTPTAATPTASPSLSPSPTPTTTATADGGRRLWLPVARRER